MWVSSYVLHLRLIVADYLVQCSAAKTRQAVAAPLLYVVHHLLGDNVYPLDIILLTSCADLLP
jgi:hypothetical protein